MCLVMQRLYISGLCLNAFRVHSGSVARSGLPSVVVFFNVSLKQQSRSATVESNCDIC